MNELEQLEFQKQYLTKLLDTIEAKMIVIRTIEKQKKINNCRHNMIYKGHGHNDDYYVCSNDCGYSEWQ